MADPYDGLPVFDDDPERVRWAAPEAPVAPSVPPEIQAMDADAQIAAAAQAGDPELERLAAAAGAAPPPPMADQALTGAMQGAAGSVAARRAYINALGPRAVSSPNAAYPIVQRATGEQLAGDMQSPMPEFQAQPFMAPERMAGESDLEYMDRVAMAKMVHDDDQASAAAEYNQVRDASLIPRARDVGRDGNIGFIEADRRASEQLHEARTEQVERMTAAETQAAIAQQAAVESAAEANREQRDYMEEQRMALERMQEIERHARAKLNAMPELNASRFTDNMGVGQKIMAVIGAFAGGMAGQSGQMAATLERLNERELREQKANYDLALTNYNAATGAVDQAMDLYRSIRDGLGDESAADAMYMSMVEEQQIQMIREEIARTSEPTAKAQLEAELLQLEQQLRTRRDANAMQIAKTPRRIVKRVDPNREERKFQRKLLEQDLKFARDLGMKGVDVGLSQDKQGFQLELEGAKAEGKAREAEIAAEAEDQKVVKQATRQWGQVETMIDDFLNANPDEIHGRGIPWTGSSGERISYDSFIKMMPEILTTAVTGAVASPEQKETFKRLVEGDWTEWSDDALRQRLRTLKSMATAQRRYYQNQLGSPNRQVENTRELSTFKPR